MSYGYIYLTKDLWTNKIYIGKHVCKTQKNYYGSGIIIRQIIKKRKHHLEKRILGYCDTKEELNEMEKICIEFYNSTNPLYGYNLSFGGEGHKLHHTQETKDKISKKLKKMGIST